MFLSREMCAYHVKFVLLLFIIKSFSEQIAKSFDRRLVGHYTVRPNSVAGKAGHIRLEQPIDSSSDKLSVHRR